MDEAQSPKIRLTRPDLVAGAILIIVVVSGLVYGLTRFTVFALRNVRHNSTKTLVHALHNYHDDHGSFPPALIRDERVNPMHSWRTLIEPYMADIMDDPDLFPPYDWSSPSTSVQNEAYFEEHRFRDMAGYQVLAVVGPETAWSESGTRSMKDFKDGTRNTLLAIAIRSTGVRWRDPVDATLSEEGSLTVNGEPVDLKEAYLILADGSVRFIEDPDQFDSTLLRALLTIDGGEEVPYDW